MNSTHILMKEEYETEGLIVLENFISEEIIKNLSAECSNLFSHTQMMGPGYSLKLSKVVSEIPNPTVKIASINLLEVAIDIHEELKKLNYLDYKLAHVALYHENKNPKELVWHSDMRNGGLIRAQIVIEGGDLNSGAFRYVKGTHKLKIEEPFPPTGFLEEKRENIFICNKKNGSLFLFDTIGYHSKCVCVETRVSLMFDFLPAAYIKDNPSDVSAEILMSSSKLSKKVIENIELFNNGVNSNTRSANTPDAYKFYKPFAGASFRDILVILKTMVLKKLGKAKELK